MTLRFKTRIALFNTIAVAITTAFVFAAIYIVVERASYRHLHRDILLEKEEVITHLAWQGDSIIINKMPEWDEAEHNKLEVNPTFLQIVDTQGVVVFHSANLLDGQFLFNPHIRQETFYDAELNQQKIHLGQFPIANEKGRIIGHLTIAVSRQESYGMLQSLLWMLLISYPLLLLVQYVASSFAAAKGIQPVHELIRSASAISDANIETRLSLPPRKDELYELARTINDLLARIETSMIRQRQFTSDASHEIRTPLAAIRGTLEVLIRRRREPGAYEEKIKDIIGQVDRINELLEQLLHLARIESGAAIAHKENIQLSSLLGVLIEKWAKTAASKGITLANHVPAETVILADKLFMELIVDNLISNAIKYGKPNGHVRLAWDDSRKALLVQDDGVGMSAGDLAQVFNRFYRADASRSSAIKGSGLGLSIVKKLCALQAIQLSVESQPGLGTTFSLSFSAPLS